MAAKAKKIKHIHLKQEIKRVLVNKRRAKNAGLVADLTLSEWLEAITHFGVRCAYCGRRLSSATLPCSTEEQRWQRYRAMSKKQLWDVRLEYIQAFRFWAYKVVYGDESVDYGHRETKVEARYAMYNAAVKRGFFLEEDGLFERLTLDHYIPLSLGGGTTKKNCLPACVLCNSEKLGKSPGEFARLSEERREKVLEWIARRENC
jgi:rRNA maturation protein Nop10